MNYEVMSAETVDIMELDYGDTFCFSDDKGSIVRMIVDNPFADLPPSIQKVVQESFGEYDCTHWFVTLDDGSLSYCGDCEVLPVKSVGVIRFTPVLN